MHLDGGSNSQIFALRKHFWTFTPIKGKITQVTGDEGEYLGIGIVLARIGDIIVPLYPSYYMPGNPQNTISTTAIKRYNDYRSVRIEALEWFKITNQEGKSTRVSTITKNVEEELLDYIKIDIMDTTTEQENNEYISAAPEINNDTYKSDILIPPTITTLFQEMKQ